MEEPIIFQVREPEAPESLDSAQDVYRYFEQYTKAAQEMFFVVYLNAKNTPIKTIRHTTGTFNSAAVYPQEIIKTALYLGASSLILAHNHPSGDPAPSSSDTEITKQIVYASKFFEIKVLDHVIIGNGKAGEPLYSYESAGYIETFERNFQDFVINAEIGRNPQKTSPAFSF